MTLYSGNIKTQKASVKKPIKSLFINKTFSIENMRVLGNKCVVKTLYL